jgi:hypothetical protein
MDWSRQERARWEGKGRNNKLLLLHRSVEALSVHLLEALPLKQGLEERGDLGTDGLTGRKEGLEGLDGGGDVGDGGCAGDGENASEEGADVEAVGGGKHQYTTASSGRRRCKSVEYRGKGKEERDVLGQGDLVTYEEDSVGLELRLESRDELRGCLPSLRRLLLVVRRIRLALPESKETTVGLRTISVSVARKEEERESGRTAIFSL